MSLDEAAEKGGNMESKVVPYASRAQNAVSLKNFMSRRRRRETLKGVPVVLDKVEMARLGEQARRPMPSA